MVLVIDRYYPDADTYSGEASYMNASFGTLPFADLFTNVPEQAVASVLNTLNEKGGVPLRILVWKEDQLYQYVFTVGVYYYVPSLAGLSLAEQKTLGLQLVPFIIVALAVLLGLWLLWQVINALVNLFWGREDDDELPWTWIAIAVIGVSAAAAYIYKKQSEKRSVSYEPTY
jgi:hypothetical protein